MEKSHEIRERGGNSEGFRVTFFVEVWKASGRHLLFLRILWSIMKSNFEAMKKQIIAKMQKKGGKTYAIFALFCVDYFKW